MMKISKEAQAKIDAITPKKFIGVGRDLASAINFNTGYRVEVEEEQ